MIPVESMQFAQMKEELKQRVISQQYDGDPFAFVSYAHKDAEQVYPVVLNWMRMGYRIYIDLDFETHGSDDNWVSQMKKKLGDSSCVLAICFRSKNYSFSYASFLELLTMSSIDTKQSRNGKILPIDVIELGDFAEKGDGFISKAQREEYRDYFHNRLKKSMGATFCQNNPEEKKMMESGLKSWLDRNPDAEISAERVMELLSEKYEYEHAHEFFPMLASRMQMWFRDVNLNGNVKQYDNWMDMPVRFKQVEMEAEEPEEVHISKADVKPVAISTEKRKPGRPAKQDKKQPAAIIEPENTASTKEILKLELGDATTLGHVRNVFSNVDRAKQFRDVRESMPRGGKGPMDYLMAALLGGCNGIKGDSPAYQINYYLYAVAQGPKEQGQLGATWTWSSNCRKVLGLEKAGQIPADFQAYFAQLGEETPLSAMVQCFLAGRDAPFQISEQKKQLIAVAAEKLIHFLNG